MPLWPFRSSEKRATGDYTDQINAALAGHFAGETGAPADVNRTAAVEFSLGMIARAFMAAEPVPAIPGLNALTLAMIARQTISLGNAVFQVGANGNGLLPVVSYSIRGNASPESWRYSVKLPFPNGDEPIDPENLPVTELPTGRVVHVRYMPRPSAPWQGVSPLVAAGISAETLAKIERSLSYDAQPIGGLILPQPDGISTRAVQQVRAALTTGQGALTPIETTSKGFGQTEAAAPKSDWEQKRFGALIPATSIDLREKITLAVLEIMGIPASLHTSAGAAQRESYRHFFTATVEPLGRLIQEELSAKMGRDIELVFPQSSKSDISARSRAFSSLVAAGMMPADCSAYRGPAWGLPDGAASDARIDIGLTAVIG